MSNDLIVQIQNQVGMLQTGLDEDTLAVAGGQFNKRISIKGGVFRKMAGGKELASLQERFMDVIFVKMAHTPSRTFYKEAYKEGVSVSPACWSSDAKSPDVSVEEPMAKTCDECPMSIKGTGQNGQGTACRLSWRTAVVLPGDPGGDVMQLVFPAASVWGKEEGGKWPFRPYVQMLANNNISAGRVVSKLQFDLKAPSPRLLISPVKGVDEADLDILMQQARSAAAENAIKLTVFKQDQVEAAAPPPPEGAPAEQGEATPEPKLREAKAPAVEEKDVSDIVKKWSRKG